MYELTQIAANHFALVSSLAVDPVPVPFDYSAAGFTGTSIMAAIQANSLALGPIAIVLFAVGMALRWVAKFAGTFRKLGR